MSCPKVCSPFEVKPGVKEEGGEALSGGVCTKFVSTIFPGANGEDVRFCGTGKRYEDKGVDCAVCGTSDGKGDGGAVKQAQEELDRAQKELASADERVARLEATLVKGGGGSSFASLQKASMTARQSRLAENSIGQGLPREWYTLGDEDDEVPPEAINNTTLRPRGGGGTPGHKPVLSFGTIIKELERPEPPVEKKPKPVEKPTGLMWV